jgi:hypothetical protein
MVSAKQNQGDSLMLRKCLLAATVAIAAASFDSTMASADPGRHGYQHRHHHKGWHGGAGHFHGWRIGPRHFHSWRSHRPAYASCWRLVPSRHGHVKVWVCR